LAELGYSCHLFEKRSHIGGNCYDEKHPKGYFLHRYGPHYFRTNSLELITWLSQFTTWIPGNYFVKSYVHDQLVSIPINLNTMTSLSGKSFTKELMEEELERRTRPYKTSSLPKNAEEFCLQSIGEELYELFFRDYTSKQWGLEAKDLPCSIVSRIPLRFNHDDRYVNEMFQYIPKEGYHNLFLRMSDHPLIKIFLNSPFDPSLLHQWHSQYHLLLYTGPIDTYFNFCFGPLPYRSLYFEWKDYSVPFMQPSVQINYPDKKYDYTRSVETKHLSPHLHQCPHTTVCFEYPRPKGEPFYPIPTEENLLLYQRYKHLADLESQKRIPTLFLGRLAEYRYLNMDQIMLHAFKMVEKIKKILK
jgi:UDP-galactopyranose mutase